MEQRTPVAWVVRVRRLVPAPADAVGRLVGVLVATAIPVPRLLEPAVRVEAVDRGDPADSVALVRLAGRVRVRVRWRVEALSAATGVELAVECERPSAVVRV